MSEAVEEEPAISAEELEKELIREHLTHSELDIQFEKQMKLQKNSKNEKIPSEEEEDYFDEFAVEDEKLEQPLKKKRFRDWAADPAKRTDSPD